MKVNTCLYTCACIYVFGVGLVAVRSNCNLCVAENISWKRSKAKGMMLCVCVCERECGGHAVFESQRDSHTVCSHSSRRTSSKPLPLLLPSPLEHIQRKSPQQKIPQK